MMRLDKYLSERLGIPRGESRKLAAKGRVTVNGVMTKKADTQIEEATAEVAVGKRCGPPPTAIPRRAAGQNQHWLCAADG